MLTVYFVSHLSAVLQGTGAENSNLCGGRSSSVLDYVLDVHRGLAFRYSFVFRDSSPSSPHVDVERGGHDGDDRGAHCARHHGRAARAVRVRRRLAPQGLALGGGGGVGGAAGLQA